MQNPCIDISKGKYQVGDELWFARDLRYKVVEKTETTYKILPIYIQNGKDVPMYSDQAYHFHWIVDDNPDLSVYKFINQQTEIKCECGGSKLGYKPGRSHSSWCKLYKD